VARRAEVTEDDIDIAVQAMVEVGREHQHHIELRCVDCHTGGLSRRDDAWTCGACGRRFPIVGGVPRFVAHEHYSGSFGFQWNRFAQAQLDSANGTARSLETFVLKTGWRLDDLAGRRVLDAGCGMGRFAEVCADAGADVHAVDLSVAVEAAHANLGGRPNVHVYQADIMRLPFTDATFDRIYSIGVLHHTPDTRAAFLALCPLLKPGGTIAIWVYTRELAQMFAGGEALRKVTPHLPKRWLLSMSRVAVPLYRVHQHPRVGPWSSWLVPTSLNPDPLWRWLDTFDWYSPKYQWKHTYEEVESWFREAGLVDVQRLPFPVSVSGVRPTSG
jgi:SAM-dependent methyltransferase